MSTTTATFDHHDTETTARKGLAAAARRKGWYQRFIDARLRQGRMHANAILVRMSDTQLAELGFSGEQIREVRATGAVPVSFWL